MSPVSQRLERVRERIRHAAEACGRPPGTVRLIAVSKRHSAASIEEAFNAGQRAFGENYLQEALEKQSVLARLPIEWHLIGPLQSNKAKDAAACFDWIHSIDRMKIAQRLSEHRPPALPPLNCCIQVNISGESAKSGMVVEELPDLARAISKLPRLHLCGLMALPAPSSDRESQREPFRQLRELRDDLQREGLALTELSMGMTDDLEPAIEEGATLVRVGTAIFGERPS